MTGATMTALFATMLVLSAAPGPSDFAVVARSLSSGFGHGVVMVAGIIAADLLFIVVAVASLSVVAKTMAEVLAVVKLACGGYLIWLGIGLLRARGGAGEPDAAVPVSRSSSFLAGLLITLGDPKAILFYMGLFPAFLDLATVTLADTVVIMLIATAVVGGVKLGYAFLADRARAVFCNARARRVLDATAGSVLAGAGAFLILHG